MNERLSEVCVTRISSGKQQTKQDVCWMPPVFNVNMSLSQRRLRSIRQQLRHR